MAYAWAAQFPAPLESLTVLDAAIPGLGAQFSPSSVCRLRAITSFICCGSGGDGLALNPNSSIGV
jgi:hypothetical protein